MGAQAIHRVVFTRHGCIVDLSSSTRSPQVPKHSIELHSLAIGALLIHRAAFTRHRCIVDPFYCTRSQQMHSWPTLACHRFIVDPACCTYSLHMHSRSIVLHSFTTGALLIYGAAYLTLEGRREGFRQSEVRGGGGAWREVEPTGYKTKNVAPLPARCGAPRIIHKNSRERHKETMPTLETTLIIEHSRTE